MHVVTPLTLSISKNVCKIEKGGLSMPFIPHTMF
jgi:hypothetical protein